MNTKELAKYADDLKDKGSDTLRDLKQAASDKVVEPMMEAGEKLADAARDGAAKAADQGRRFVRATDEWVESHPYSVAGITFLAGIAVGALLTKHLRD